MPYSYTKIFDPPTLKVDMAPNIIALKGDRRDGLVYLYTEELVLAVNVALATGRPLLVRGPSGSGKSSFARNVALWKGWHYYEEVITNRTRALDFLWHFDALGRLNDAQANQLRPIAGYVKPGVLWHAFDPEGAKRQEYSTGVVSNPSTNGPPGATASTRAVVLLDEIDKADPDVPNDLLVPLGSLQFEVEVQEFKLLIEARRDNPPLIIITTNDERRLPDAFQRRCVILKLDSPDAKRLVEIAEAHFGPAHTALYESIADLIDRAKDGENKAMPSAAEYLDAVQACRDLEVTPGAENETWQAISQATLWKPRDPLRGT